MSAERVRPISPKDVVSEKLKLLPDEVLESFNQLIIQNSREGEIIVDQDEVVALMETKGLDRNLIFKNGWLDIEDIYRKAGWKVEYDKPAYDESYSPHFIFSRPRNREK